MSFCCSEDLPERVQALSKKSKEGFVRVMPIPGRRGSLPVAAALYARALEDVRCDCGAPAEFNISYQNKEGEYVWPRAIRNDEKHKVVPISDTSGLIDIKNPQSPKE